MRRKVPFLGEERIARADDEEAQAKKNRGHLIDDVLSSQKQPSTWDDLVTNDYPDPVGASPKMSRAHSPAPVLSSSASKLRPKKIPVTAGTTTKKTSLKGSNSNGNNATIDWLPINSGHALRINICGTLDHNLRHEWRKLLDDAATNDVGQFEFNLTESPTLTLTGLGMLLMFKEQKGSGRGDIKLCHCNRDVWQLLQWTGMDKYFTIQGIIGPGDR
jgi:anti-anti-sigma factor